MTASKVSPVSRSASSAGFPMVAEDRTKRGRPPYRATSRRNLRRTIDTCDPNTPRATCASSTTTRDSRRKKSAHLA